MLFHIFDLFAQRKPERLLPAKIIRPLEADILYAAKVTQRRAKIRIPARRDILRRINRQNVALAAPCRKAQSADRTRIGAQEEIAERRIFSAVLCPQAFHIERKCRFLACGLRDDIDDAADGISAVLRARRAADRHADIPHRIDRARHADLAEDNVLDRLGLLLLNVLPGDNRRALTFVLGLFLGRVDLNDNVSRFDPIVPPPADCPPRRRAGSAR